MQCHRTLNFSQKPAKDFGIVYSLINRTVLHCTGVLDSCKHFHVNVDEMPSQINDLFKRFMKQPVDETIS